MKFPLNRVAAIFLLVAATTAHANYDVESASPERQGKCSFEFFSDLDVMVACAVSFFELSLEYDKRFIPGVKATLFSFDDFHIGALVSYEETFFPRALVSYEHDRFEINFNLGWNAGLYLGLGGSLGLSENLRLLAEIDTEKFQAGLRYEYSKIGFHLSYGREHDEGSHIIKVGIDASFSIPVAHHRSPLLGR